MNRIGEGKKQRGWMWRQTDRRSKTLEARSSVDGDAQLDADDGAVDGPETDATSSARRSARVVPKDA